MSPNRLAALVALLAAAPVAAQPTTPPSGSGLPTITPRVFISTGPVRVPLPPVTRTPQQTTTAPPPRTYIVPTEREPTVEPFEPPVEALPPLQIDAPPEPEARIRPSVRFRAEAAVGSYFARSGRLDLQAEGESGVFFLDADLDGLSGSGSDDYVHSDRLAVRAGGQSYATGRLRLEGVVLADAYSLPGVSDERRRRLVGGTTVGISGLGAIPYDLRLGYTQSDLRLLNGDDPTTEGRVDAEGRVGLAQNRFRLDGAGGISGDSGGFGDVGYGSVGAAVAFGRADGARLLLGVRGLLADAADAGGVDSRSAGPIVDLTLPMGPGTSLFAVNNPHLEVRSLAALSGLNPYVAPSSFAAPDVLPVDAQVGLQIARGTARARAYALGTLATSRLFFERGGGYYFADYAGATTVGVGADVAVGAADTFSASAGIEARAARLDGGGDLPFYAPFVVRGGLQAPFASGRGRAGLTLSAESARPSSRGESVDAPAFALVGLDARYDVSGPFSIIGRAERLVGTVERWPGFREAPFTVVLGLRLVR